MQERPRDAICPQQRLAKSDSTNSTLCQHHGTAHQQSRCTGKHDIRLRYRCCRDVGLARPINPVGSRLSGAWCTIRCLVPSTIDASRCCRRRRHRCRALRRGGFLCSRGVCQSFNCSNTNGSPKGGGLCHSAVDYEARGIARGEYYSRHRRHLQRYGR